MRPRRDRTPTLALAIGAAFLAHVVVLVIDDGRVRERPIAVDAPSAVEPTAETPLDVTPTSIALVSLDAVDLAALPLIVVPGPGDAAGFDATSPMPRASADLPGDTAADRGGGAAGGEVTWTGRRDPDQTALRAQMWSDPDRYRAPREDRDRRAATSEAIARQPDQTYGDRQVRARARAGEPAPSRGELDAGTGAGHGTATAAGDDVAAAAGKTAPARADGATRVSPEAALVDPGATATDVERHGKVGDDVAVAAASDQRDPDPYDLTPARAGGTDEGVRGKRDRDGALADGRGHGTGASRSDAELGDDDRALMASRTDPYLRNLMRKLDDEIVFPRDLKLDLRSGRVIVTLVLAADGKTSDLVITLTSGYDGFDRELVRAIKAVGNLGKVPERLLDGKRSLALMVPYTFKNPMIR